MRMRLKQKSEQVILSSILPSQNILSKETYVYIYINAIVDTEYQLPDMIGLITTVPPQENYDFLSPPLSSCQES